jgi:Ni/Co efflux regulator RcnB
MITLLAAALFAATPALSQDKSKKGEKPHTAAEEQKDIQDHRAMAEAHTAAAKCLQSGKGEKVCHDQLAKDCKGLGIGKLCGMKHHH